MTTTPTTQQTNPATKANTERTIEGRGPGALTPSGQTAPVFFSTEAEHGTELLDVLPGPGFRVARLTAGNALEMVFAKGENVGEKLRRELKAVPRGAFVTAILENIVPAMAEAKASFVVAESGRRVAMTGFGPSSSSGSSSSSKPSSSSATVGTRAMPARRVPPPEFRPMTPAERGEGVTVPLLKHQVTDLIRHFEMYPRGHLPHGVKVPLRVDLEKSIAWFERFKVAPKAPPPDGVEVHAVLPEGIVRWFAADHLGNTGVQIHPEDREILLEGLRASLRAPVDAPFVAPPIEPPPVVTAQVIASKPADMRIEGSCDVCDKPVEDGQEFITLDAERWTAGPCKREENAVHFTLCKGCASPANISAAMTSVAKHVSAFLNGAAS